VLGATLKNIVGLLSKDFVKLIIAALAITIPLAVYLTDQWLANFAYRTELHWTIFLSGALSLLTVALLTIGIKSIRAAQANPVDSLRNE
jgi:putative ABC transport system permease protein